jgi:hypothetical protein
MISKGKTDRQTDRTTRWAFTAYEGQWSYFNDINVYSDVIAEWGYQEEVCPETKRRHYQGYIRTHRQHRLSAMIKLLSGVHIEIARDWKALLNYCKKAESAIEGTQVKAVSDYEHWSMPDLFINMAGYAIDYFEIYRRLLVVDKLSIKQVKDAEYWYCVNRIIKDDEKRIAMFATPQVRTLWLNTRETWIAKVEEARADSITCPCS